jgi:hypothetical protein
MASLGDAIDEMRVKNSGHVVDEVRPAMRKVDHYIPHVLPDPSGGWAAMFSPKDYHTNIPVYEGETDDAARGRKDWEDQQPTAYMLSRTASQASFGATSHAWTSGFEQEYTQDHPSDVKPIEMAAMANNLVGWKMTPAGAVLDKVFSGVTGAISRKVMQSQIGARMIEERLAVPVRAWMQAAFGRTTDAAAGPAASAAVKLEQALSNAGGHALADGGVYVPQAASAAAKAEVKAAVNALRQEMGAAGTPVKMFTKDSALTGLGRLVTAATHVGGGAATGATAGAVDRLTEFMVKGAKGDKAGAMEGLASLPESTWRGAKWGGAAGAAFGAAGDVVEAFAARGTKIPAGVGATQPDLARLRAGLPALPAGSPSASVSQPPNVWNIATMGPVPTGWKGKVISK